MLNTERRGFRAPVAIETRADGQIVVTGRAAVFNTPASIGGWFDEIIEPGAFSEALKTDDVRFLINHEGLPLARSGSGTLDLDEDDDGLNMRAVLDPKDPEVKSLVPKLKRGDVDEMSFMFTMRGGVEEWDETDEENPIRRIKQVGSLFDVSAVTFGAYPETQIGLRTLDEYRKNDRTTSPAANAVAVAKMRADIIDRM